MAVMTADGSMTFTRGDDIRFPMTMTENDGTTAIDLTGSTLRAEVRKTPNGTLLFAFEILQEDPADGTEYDLAEGQFLLFAEHAVTEVLRFKAGEETIEAVWDLEHTSAGGIVTTYPSSGPATVTIVKDVTLPEAP